MDTIDWISNTGGDWSDAADWSGGVEPGTGDDAVIQGSADYTVTVTMAATANSLTVNDPVALVSISSGGTVSLVSSLDLEAGEVELSAGGVISGGTLSQNGGTFLFKGGAVDGVTYQGTLNLSAVGDGFEVSGAGLVLTGAGGAGAGEVNMTGEGASLIFEGDQTLGNATVNLNSKYGANLVHHDGTLTLGSNLTINVLAGYGDLQDDERGAPGDQLINDGTIAVTTVGGTLGIEVIDFVNQGTLEVGDGGKLELSGGGDFSNAATGVLTIGAGESLRLQNQVNSLAGVIDGAGAVTLTRTTLLSGLGFGGILKVTDAGSIQQTGAVALGDASGGAVDLTIGKTDSYDIEDDVDITRGASTASRIVVDGQFAKIAGTGLAGVQVAVVDKGVIDAAAGVLDFSQAITGAGTLEVNAGARLRLGGSVASTLTVIFEAPGGALALNQAKTFAAAIDGFAPGETIDLVNMAATTVTLEAGDKLLVQNGALTAATLQLAGVFTGDTFDLSSDGKGGINITVTSAPAAFAPPLLQAMAAFAAPSASAHTTVAADTATRHTILLAPR